MKGLTEESIAQIEDPEKLRYLLSGVVQKNAKQLKRVRILQRQLKNTKTENQTLISYLNELKANNQMNDYYKFDHEFEKIRADFNEFALSSLLEITQNLEIENFDTFYKETKRYQEEFRSRQTVQLDNLQKIISEKDLKLAEKEKTINELNEKFEQIESSPISKDVEELLAEKDQSIVKLRALIQRYAKSDQIKQQQIDDQQRQIQQYIDSLSNSSSFNNLNFSNKSSDNEKIALLEQKVSQLQSLVNSSDNSKELENKCEKLYSMLDKSNHLYTQLNEKYNTLQNSLRKDKRLIIQQNILFEVMNETNEKKKKSDSRNGINKEMAVIVSLRKTLLQFFLTDEENQINLIPVILEIVGCNKDQVEGALRNHQSHQTLISRAGSIFGLFG